MTPLLSAVAGTGGVYHMDIFDLCAAIPRGSVDMILCDLPYGTTACSWDTVIPFAPMWAAFKRVIKPRGAIVLTASQPFTSVLICSNLSMFRYEWIWQKPQGVDPFMRDLRPLSDYEDVCIFGVESPVYFPQFKAGEPYRAVRDKHERILQITDTKMKPTETVNDGYRYPTRVLKFGQERGDHPTQKPVDLFRYLIRTYTRPGELVFDPCCGSGTTAVAAREEGRRFIVGDSSLEYVGVTRRRLDAPYTPSFMPGLEAATA